MPAERQPAAVLAALGGPALPLAAMTLPLTIFLPAFFASVIGLKLAVVGLTFTVVRTADLIFDPFVGGLMDRTRSRFGQFKPWMAFGAPVLMAGAALLFLARPGVGAIYLALALVVSYAGYSIVILSQMGMGAALSPDYNERSRVFAWWQIFNVGGIILVLVLPPALSLVMPVDQTVTVRSMGVAILLLTPLTVLVALAVVPDRKSATGCSPHASAPAGSYLQLFRLRSVRLLLTTVLANGLGLGVSASVFVFFFNYVKDIRPQELSLMLAGFSTVSICSAQVWAWLGHRLGKHRAMALGGLGYAIYSAITVIMPARGFAVYGLAAVIGGFASCSTDLLPRSMIADIADEDRLTSHGDRSGMLYAMLLITHKIGQAAAIGIVFSLLDLIGFRASIGAANSHAALTGILVLGGVIPGLLYLTGAAVVFFYPLTAGRHAEIRRELDRRGESVGADPIAEMAEPGVLGASIDPALPA